MPTRNGLRTLRPTPPAPTRVLLYSHDALGLGHARRNLALAHTLAQQLPELTGRPVTGLLLSGLGSSIGELPPGFDMVNLPGICKGQGGYLPRNVVVPMGELSQMRSRILTAAVIGFGPDLMIVDRHAYGAEGELREALGALRVSLPTARVVLGLREVLDEPAVAQREWAKLGDPEALRLIFDEIWVYGDPAVHDVSQTGELPPELADRTRHTGYLATGRRAGPGAGQTVPYVLTMAGGGADGAALCRAAAAAPVPTGHTHLVVTGPQMPAEDHQAVCRAAGPDTRVVRQVPDGLSAVRGASAVIAMAGYNTVCEVLSTQVPVLLVPREQPRREQAIRAEGLRRRAAVEVCPIAVAGPERLGDWLAGAVTRRVSRTGLDLGGLDTVATHAAALLAQDTSYVARSSIDFWTQGVHTAADITTEKVQTIA